MTLPRTIVLFGVPGAIIYIALHFGVPLASERGVPLIVSWTLGLWAPIILVLCGVLFRWHRGTSKETFKTRFRLKPLGKRGWLIILTGFFGVQICELLLSKTGAIFSQYPIFSKPIVLPELFDPALQIDAGLETFFGVPVLGNWWLILFWLGWLVVNIGGEELLWRGYALPLQEKVFGRYAWLVNGLCWNLLIHAFMLWNFLTLMPISLILPYLVQRYQNTWIGIYLHGLGNLLVLVILVPSIAGWI